MCGRYSNDKNVDDMAKAYEVAGGRGADFIANWAGRFSLAPTDAVPIVRETLDEGTIERELRMARWDFRPHWRTDARPLINARLETVAAKRTFRDALVSRRAIVPMSGYFEWTGPPKDKTPHYVLPEASCCRLLGCTHSARSVRPTVATSGRPRA